MATIGGVTITNKQPTAQSSWQKQAEFTIAAWRKRAEQEKKEKERQARLREQQRQWRDWSERYRQSMAAVNPTADPNASSTEYKKRAAEAMGSTAKRATAMGLPSVLADRAFGEVAQETPYWRSREAVKKVGALTPEEIEAQENDPMFEYQRLSRSWGADVVGERMATIKDMWDVYGIPYSGDALVWELTKSQFTMPEIKNMLEEAHYLMYEDPDRLNLRDMAVDELWVHMRDTYNMKPEQFESFKELFEAQRKNELPSQWESGDKLGAILTMSLFIPVPGMGWARAIRGATRGFRAATETAELTAATAKASPALRAAMSHATATERALARLGNTELGTTAPGAWSAMTHAERVASRVGTAEATEAAINLANVAGHTASVEATAAGAALAAGTGRAALAAEAGQRLATAGVQTLRFGGKFQAVMSGFGGLMELSEEQRLSAIADKQVRAEKALELAGSPISQVLPVLQTEQELPNPFQELKELRAALGAFNTPENRDDIIQICEEMQEFGVGTDLEVTGVLGWDWQEAITDAYKDGIRAVYDEQRLAIEEGDADYDAEINGDMDDPYWQEVFARREERQLQSDQAKAENYDRWMWFERSGIPRNSLEAAALGRRIASNGWLQAAYGSLLHTALTIGQVVDATASAINLNVRQWKDPAYQAAIDDLVAYVDAQVITGTTGGYAGQPEHADEAFARAQIMDPAGPLANDPEAKRLLAAVDQRQAELIDEDYDADFLETAGLLFGSSPERMKQIEQDHPDIVRAFTTGVYIATAKVNPVGRIYRAAFKPTVDSNMAAFLGSNRAKMMVDRVSSYLSQLDAGRAISYIKGTSAAPIINRLWRLQGKKVDHVSPKSQILRDLANEVVDAVDRGTPERVATVLRGADDAVVDGVVREAAAHLNTVAQQSQGYLVLDRTWVNGKVATWLAKRQNKHHDAVSKELLSERLNEQLAVEYAKGADIFPYLRENHVLPPNRVLALMNKRISQVKNDWLRSFLSKWTVGLITRAPTTEIELRDLNTLDRVYDAALTISQDAGWAWTFRNKWAASTNNVRLLKLVDELEAKFDQKFYAKDKQEPLPWTRRVGQALGKEYEQGGQALAPLPDAVLRGLVTEKTVAETPMLTKYNLSTPGKRGQTTAQAVPDTTYQQYLVSLHRSSLWAPYRLPMHGKSLEAFARNSPVILKNIYRSVFLGPAHKVSTPLRQWTVMMGAPLLFQKHALTDSFRTYMETGGSSLIESFGLRGVSINGLKIVPKILSFHARKMEDVLSTLSPSLRDTILYSKARVHASEAQWLSGTSKQVFRPKTIRDADGKIIDLDGSAHALRRILEGKAFQQYSQGGYGAVQLWLDTREGKAFLREGGWYTRHKEMWKEQHAGEALPTIKQSELHEIVKQEYLDTIVQKEFMRLETALPNIMPVMKEMALNEKLWDVNRLKKLIEENPTDNAVLSMPAHIWAGNSMAGYIVGKAMFANKWNRDVVFDHIFIRQYNKLTKEGIEADNAARVAATIAEINTSRIHFDLSNALAVEARHRWLAWFATKHRLFGTYIMKLAIERPTIAAAAVEIKNWMEERNEKLGVGEFDRYDLVIPRADGSQWRINLAPYMWFAEFPLESSLATAMEHAAAFVADKTVGWELHPSPTPFGLTFTRADALITNFWYVMTADNAVKQPADLLESGEAKDLQEAHEMANESLTNWLNSLSPSQALRWRKLINNQRALALARGEQWTALMAFNEVRRSVLIDEAFKCFKAYSGRNMSAEEVEIERLLKEFSDLSATDQEAARELLAKEPELAAVLNAQMDPVEKEEYDEHWRLFNIFRAAFQRDLENADKNGTLINDYDRLADEFARNIDRLVNPTYQAGENSIYSEVFARSFGDYNPEEFIKSIGLFMPTIPPGSVWETGRAKTKEEKDAKIAELEVAFNEAIAQLHLMPAETVGKKHAGGDSSQLLYKMIYDELVTIPLSEYAGESDYSLLPYRAANAAGYLANGGDETLVYRADVFMDTVKERTFRQWMASGLGSYGTATSPMAAYILDDQWDMLGMNRDPGARQAWMEWALADWAVKYWAKTTTYEEAVTAGIRDKWLPDSYLTKTPEELAKDKEDWGVSTSSTIYKSLREFWLGEDSVLLQRLMGNSGFRAEYEFSKLKLHERLIALGVGMGDDEESKGMAEFLGLCSDYWDELGQIENPAAEGGVGVGPTASRARPVWDKYIEKVADLAERNRDWWVMFRGTYSLNQFGFVTTWRKKDRPDIEALYSNADAYIEPGFTDEPEWYE